MDRKILKRICYNSDAESFHTKNSVTDIIQHKLRFIHQKDKFVFCATFEGIRDNVCNSSTTAGLKVCGRLLIRELNFFASSYS